MKTLLLVESPTKAKKLQGLLGNDYVVQATFGHMFDLPVKGMGIDLETLEETYVVLESKGRIDYNDLIARIKKLAKECDRVVLASDPDREGEAIAWHVLNMLKLKDSQYDRIELREITAKGLDDALQHRRKLDVNWVNAQRARRVLDRLMGYGISPVLMREIDTARSAGRVQSAALRMIVERDRLHEQFVAEKRYTVEGSFEQNSLAFTAQLLVTQGVYDYATPLDGAAEDSDVEDKESKSEAASSKKRGKKFVSGQPVDSLIEAVKEISDNDWSVISHDSHEVTVPPKPPLITSTLQQVGFQRFNWSGEDTMRVAQKLFEHGYITYMRTDSVRIAQEAQDEARAFLAEQYGVDLVPDVPNVFKNKNASQDGHEAIRPTHVRDTSSVIQIDEDKSVNNIDARMLYDLIREIFLCSQAAPGRNMVSTAVVEDVDGKFQFEASVSVAVFAGWRQITQDEAKSDAAGLKVAKGPTTLLSVEPKESQTRPRPRYKEDSLNKELERNGVGRPASYAAVTKTLKQRDYIVSKGKELISTELGRKVVDWLVQRASHYTDVHFTAQMEARLDQVEAGKENKEAIMTEVRDDLKERFHAFEDRANRKPSDKQLEFLNKLRGQGEKVPDGAFETMTQAKTFLDEFMNSRGPSEKQVQFALSLSQSTGKDYTDSMRMSAVQTKKFIDESLLFAQKNNIRTGGGSDRPATEKQVEMAKKLAAEQGIAWDPALEVSMQQISAFIDERMKNRPAGSKGGGGAGGGPDRPATEKQIALAQSIAKRVGENYPDSYKSSMQKTSAFIDKHMKK